MAFQKEKKLPEDGELNPQTLLALGVDLNNWFLTSGSMSKPSANEQDQARSNSNAQAGSAKRTGQGAPSSAQSGSARNVQANLNGASMSNPAGSSSVTPGQTVGLRPRKRRRTASTRRTGRCRMLRATLAASTVWLTAPICPSLAEPWGTCFGLRFEQFGRPARF